MSCKEEFIEIFKANITREGADKLLDYLEHKSDFFTAPASARYHGAYEGGLCEHSLNVYHCLVDYLQRERVQELYGLDYSGESIAIVALCHDLCKIGCYKKTMRNVKDDATGQWTKVPSFLFDDPLPYGHGEKSVYITNGFIRLTREEAMAIRWHMGFSGTEDNRLVGRAFAKYPLAFAPVEGGPGIFYGSVTGKVTTAINRSASVDTVSVPPQARVKDSAMDSPRPEPPSVRLSSPRTKRAV